MISKNLDCGELTQEETDMMLIIIFLLVLEVLQTCLFHSLCIDVRFQPNHLSWKVCSMKKTF
jgi:hypothetical protein